MRWFVFALVMTLAACKVEPSPGRWSDYLNPYMAERGYTMASDGETILKNGRPVWFDPICYGRGCGLGNQPLVPGELVSSVRVDFFDAIRYSQEQYVKSVSAEIGLEPLPQTIETDQ